MSGCGREDRLADGSRATCGHRIHGPTAPAFVCRDCLLADRDRLAAELARVRTANRVLDSAAKDAQMWAYQLQECRAELERAHSALRVIVKVRYGLDITDTDEERADYWFKQCEMFKRVARAALAQPQDGTTEGRG